MTKFIIYGLVDPRDEQLRYIGKSSKGLVRPRQHGQAYFLRVGAHTRLSRWIESLRAAGLDYRITVLQEHQDPATLNESECLWIAHHRGLGCDLTNLTVGGDGRSSPCSSEHRKKIGDANRGRKCSAETRAKMSTAHRGRKSPNRGRVWSTEYKAKMTAARGGRPFVDQYGVRYESFNDAARRLGTSAGSVSAALRKNKTSRGRTFRFVE